MKTFTEKFTTFQPQRQWKIKHFSGWRWVSWNCFKGWSCSLARVITGLPMAAASDTWEFRKFGTKNNNFRNFYKIRIQQVLIGFRSCIGLVIYHKLHNKFLRKNVKTREFGIYKCTKPEIILLREMTDSWEICDKNY